MPEQLPVCSQTPLLKALISCTLKTRDRKLLLFTLSVLEAHAPVFNSTGVSAQNAGNFFLFQRLFWVCIIIVCQSFLWTNWDVVYVLCLSHMLHQLPDPPTLLLNEGGNPLRAFHQLSEEEQETGQCCPPLPMLSPPAALLPLGIISLLNLVLSCVYVRGPTGVSEDIPALESSGSIWSILYTNRRAIQRLFFFHFSYRLQITWKTSNPTMCESVSQYFQTYSPCPKT